MSNIRYAVLQVLAGQSPGYYAHPNASAFISEGFDPEEVEAELIELANEGLAERETFVQVIRTAREIYLERMDQALSEVENAKTKEAKAKAQEKYESIWHEGEGEHETVPMQGGFAITEKGRELLAAGEPDTKPKKVKQSKKRVE